MLEAATGVLERLQPCTVEAATLCSVSGPWLGLGLANPNPNPTYCDRSYAQLYLATRR